MPDGSGTDCTAIEAVPVVIMESSSWPVPERNWGPPGRTPVDRLVTCPGTAPATKRNVPTRIDDDPAGGFSTSLKTMLNINSAVPVVEPVAGLIAVERKSSGSFTPGLTVIAVTWAGADTLAGRLNETNSPALLRPSVARMVVALSVR